MTKIDKQLLNTIAAELNVLRKARAEADAKFRKDFEEWLDKYKDTPEFKYVRDSMNSGGGRSTVDADAQRIANKAGVTISGMFGFEVN